MVDDLNILKRDPGVLGIYSRRVKLKKQGKELVCCCPMHGESTPSFKITVFDGVYVFRCFGCQARGDIVDFVSKFENVSLPAAIEIIKRELGKDFKQSFTATKRAEQTFKSLSQDDKPAISYSLEEYSKLEKDLENSEEGKKWLESRGISYETAKKYHIGFRKEISSFSSSSGKSISNLGWISFPCIEKEKVVSIKYRSIQSKEFTKQGGMAKGDQTPLFPNDRIDFLEPIILSEGECDALVLLQAGFQAKSVQSSSNPLTASNKELLLEAEYLVLAGDNDTVGNEYMDKVWAEISERTFKLKWPDNLKDANEVYLIKCKSDIQVFRDLVLELIQKARSEPMKGVSNLQEAMMAGVRVDLEDHPSRLKMPWKTVDNMANILPGSITYIFASQTGTGKSTLLANILTEAALRGEVVLNYSSELSFDEYANMVASYIIRKNRNELTKEDYLKAAFKLRDSRFYVGYDPDLQKADDILDLIEEAVRRLGAGTVALDHIHHAVRNEHDTIKAQENAMRRIKSLATKYKLKWINIGQPRKANQQTRGKLVMISDSKGSESIISDSDVVLAMHRNLAKVDDPNNPPKEPFDPLTEIHLLKGRSQGKGKAYTELMFDGKICTFFEVEKQDPERLIA